MSATRNTESLNTQQLTVKQDDARSSVTWLNFTQDRMIDLLADLISRGGTRRNLCLLVEACLDHQWRREFTRGFEPEEIKTHARKWVDKNFEEWSNQLIAGIQMRRILRKSLAEGKQACPSPKSVAERIRQGYLDRLQTAFEEFMGEAEPEEVRFMVDVLANRRGEIAAGDSGTVREVLIASNFYNTIEGGHHSYIRVPEQIQADVEAYANALLKARAGKAA